MTGPANEQKPETSVPGEHDEHPLSVLLFSWMRTKLFVRVLMVLLAVFGVAMIGLEFLVKAPGGHVPVPGFYGVFGFIAFSLAVLSGWPLGKLMRRPEDYYERRSGEAGRDR